MILLFFITCILSLNLQTRQALREEDIRMARHLISEGITVTHPEYPFLKRENWMSPVKKHDSEELGKEDARMFRHLRGEGFTVN